jgi:hypothetical protein
VSAEDNYKYFVDNLQKLYTRYGHKYIAIKDKSVIGAYGSFEDAYYDTIQHTPLGTFII